MPEQPGRPQRGVHALRCRAGLAVSASKDALRLWDVTRDAPAALCALNSPAAGAEVSALELWPGGDSPLSPQSCTLFCGDRLGATRAFDAAAGACTLSLPQSADGPVAALCLLHEGTALVIASVRRVCVFYLRASARAPAACITVPGGATALCAPLADGGADCGCVLVGGGDGRTTLWDARRWEALQAYAPHDAHGAFCALDADAIQLAVGYAHGGAALFAL